MCKLRECLQQFSWLSFIAALFLAWMLSNLPQVDGGWSAQCWRKHNSGSIQTPDGEFKRPFGILCTYQCFLWFPPIFPYCEFIFDLRLSRHFDSFPDCYLVRCNETFSLFGASMKTF